MKCYQCGESIEDTARFCPFCGSSQVFTSDLIQKAIDGNQDAITELYNRTYNNVYRTIKAMVKDEDTVLDILQDSYIKGFQSLKQLDKPENYRAWMKRIATNKTKDWLKRKKPVLFSELVDEDSDEDLEFEDTKVQNLPEQVIEQQETTRLINEILDSLSEEQRLVIGMFYYEQMSVKEIAEIIGCSENTVKSRLNYGRKKIEIQVLELEKKGTKLYGLAPIPFLLLLFKNMDVQAAELPSEAVLSMVQAKIGAAAFNAANVGAKALEETVKSSIGTLGKGLAVKILVGGAGVILVGGIIGGVDLYSKNQEYRKAIVDTEEIYREAEDTYPETGYIEAMENQTENRQNYQNAYKVIMDEYKSACMDEVYSELWNSNRKKLEELYPNVSSNITMFYYHCFYPLGRFYYAYYDIDNNGTEELLIGEGDHDYEDSIFVNVIDVYAFDGEKAVKLIDNPALGDRSYLAIQTDGTMIEHNSSGASSGSYRFSRISDDGYSNIAIKEYNYDGIEYPDKPFYNEDEALTAQQFEDFMAMYTEVTDFDWNIFASDHNSIVQGTEDEIIGSYVNNDKRMRLVITANEDNSFYADWNDESGWSTRYEVKKEDGIYIARITLPHDMAALTFTLNNDTLEITGDSAYYETVQGQGLDGIYFK